VRQPDLNRKGGSSMRILWRVATVVVPLWVGSAVAQVPDTPVEVQTENLEAGPSEVQTLPPGEIKPPKSRVPSFQRGPGTRAGGPANELNTGDERTVIQPPGGDALGSVTGQKLYHGNYCGAGNAGPGSPAVDELDAVCKRHDECYDAAGYPSCRCDEQLRLDALEVAELKRLPNEVRGRAASVAQAAELMQCQKP
jgi:hypothetical protein